MTTIPRVRISCARFADTVVEAMEPFLDMTREPLLQTCFELGLAWTFELWAVRGEMTREPPAMLAEHAADITANNVTGKIDLIAGEWGDTGNARAMFLVAATAGFGAVMELGRKASRAKLRAAVMEGLASQFPRLDEDDD